MRTAVVYVSQKPATIVEDRMNSRRQLSWLHLRGGDVVLVTSEELDDPKSDDDDSADVVEVVGTQGLRIADMSV